jgi:hypothetical protein
MTVGVTAALALALLVVDQPPAVMAADPAGFNPGNIISDAEFFNGDGMAADQIQAFLDSKVPHCATATAYRGACLKDITMSMQAHAGDDRCGPITAGTNLLAATVIARIGLACNINPKVILVTLQKERGLVQKTSPISADYKVAMGYGCPDTAACDSQYYGFANQVYRAARQFQTYRLYPTSFAHRAGRTQAVRYHPNASCGSSQVYIANAATAALYNYTPYQPNAAALAAGYGASSNPCASYGNRNFYLYYSDWFGTQAAGDSTPIPLLNSSFDDPTVDPWVQGNGNAVTFVQQSGTEAIPAHGGSQYLVVQTAKPSGSVRQDIARSSAIGDTYTVSAWVRSGVPGTPVQGQVAIAAIGGVNESQRAPFVAGDEWQQISATLTMKKKGHYVIRAALYLDTAGVPLLFDDVLSAPSDTTDGVEPSEPGDPGSPPAPVVIANPSFETTAMSGWKAGDGSSSLQFARTQELPSKRAQHGDYFLSATTATGGTSFNQDVAYTTQPGVSYTLSAWVRAADASAPIEGQIAIAAKSATNESKRTDFTAGSDWALVSTTLLVLNPGNDTLRAAFYLDTAGAGLLVDNVTIVPGTTPSQGLVDVQQPEVAGVAIDNPSFESGSTAPWKKGRGTDVRFSVKTLPGAPDGDRFLAMYTLKPAMSIDLDLPIALSKGDTYEVTAWVRSSAQTAVKGELALAGKIGTLGQSVRGKFSVGSTWTRITTTITLGRTFDTLRIALYLDTKGRTMYVDDISLAKVG